MPNPVTHFEIFARDSKQAQAFYGGLFGWHIDANNPMSYAMVDTHTGRGINGGLPQSEDGLGTIIYVEVDDLQAYLDKAESLGGKTVMPPTTIPNMVSFALFTDPDGNRVGLVKEESGASR